MGCDGRMQGDEVLVEEEEEEVLVVEEEAEGGAEAEQGANGASSKGVQIEFVYRNSATNSETRHLNQFF